MLAEEEASIAASVKTPKKRLTQAEMNRIKEEEREQQREENEKKEEVCSVVAAYVQCRDLHRCNQSHTPHDNRKQSAGQFCKYRKLLAKF